MRRTLQVREDEAELMMEYEDGDPDDLWKMMCFEVKNFLCKLCTKTR